MKTKAYKTLRLAAVLHCLSITRLMAHPGPPGHTHDDGWPFDPIPVVSVALGITLVMAAAIIFKKRSNTARTG